MERTRSFQLYLTVFQIPPGRAFRISLYPFSSETWIAYSSGFSQTLDFDHSAHPPTPRLDASTYFREVPADSFDEQESFVNNDPP
jgi:hypothetical protein